MYTFYSCQSISVGQAIYTMDWTVFSIETKKSLMMTMKRTLHPIKFTSGDVVTLSIDSFNNVIEIFNFKKK